MSDLTPRQRRALGLLFPNGTVARGLSIYLELKKEGFVRLNANKRYELTRLGAELIAALPEAELGRRLPTISPKEKFDRGR